MQLREVMTPNVETIRAEASLAAAAERMEALNIGALPVVGANGLEGVVTDRDIVIRGVAAHRDPSSTPVMRVMTEKALSMPQETPVSEAVAAMEQQQVRRLLVVDSLKQVVGIVSLGDLAMRGGREVAGEVLEKVSDPTGPVRAPGDA